MKKQHILSATAAFFLLSGSVFAGTVNETIADTFPNDDYANNNGSVNFSARWIDSQDQDSSDGTITLSNNSYEQAIMEDSGTYTLSRMLDLDNAVGDVNLTITTKGNSGDEQLDVKLWNETDATWDILDTLTADGSEHTNTYTISDNKYLTHNSAIRFVLHANNDADWKIRDVSFSVDFPDTDEDGISDAKDIDDDNDGILSALEVQGDSACTYGFYQVSYGTLYLYDPENSSYLQIGEDHNNYNAMGYDKQTGRLYAVATEDGTDDDGVSYSANDVLLINKQTGKIKKIGSVAQGTAAADFYDGKLYYRSGETLRSWSAADGTDTEVISSGIGNTYDLSIIEEDGKVYAYGINQSDGKFTRINISDKTVSSTSLSIEKYAPDGNNGNELSTYWGASFVSNDNELYIANNFGYLYQITDYDTDKPKAYYVKRSFVTGKNDGASCRSRTMYAPDTDNDGFKDYLDLDSDNDGIPDNIEAQSTSNYTEPSGKDDDGDGLDDNYDSNTNGISGSYGLVPLDTDGDHTPDYVDSDSDNDGYTDCDEGNTDRGKSCENVEDTVGNNGLASWAEEDDSDDYSDPNGNVNDPEDDGKLFNETGDSSEAGYREFLCGKSDFKLTEYQWRLISVPCDTGSISIKDLFGDILGEYGDDNHWIMYKQTGDDNYEVNESHKNTDKVALEENATLKVGVSYWIITDANKTINIDKTLNGLSPTTTTDTSDVSIDDDLFDKVHEFDLPANDADNVKKLMVGNPFPYRFDFSKLYFKNEDTNYSSMASSNNDDYILARIYTHDSSDTSDKNVSNGGGYSVIVPQTPGLSEGQIVPMEGFFIELEKQSDEKSNKFAYPLMMQYSN